MNRHQLPVLGLLFLAGLVRLFFIINFPHVEYDGKFYSQIANNINDYHIYSAQTYDDLAGSIPKSTMRRVPGYPLFLAATYKLFGRDNYQAVRYFQLIFDMGTCYLVYLIASIIFSANKKIPIVALLISTLSPFNANYTATVMAETITIFLLTLSLYYFVLSRQTKSTISPILLSGLFAGISCQFRPDSFLLPLVVFLFLIKSSFKNSLLYLATVCLILTPWTIRNYSIFGTFQPLAPGNAQDPTDAYYQTGYDNWTKAWVWNYDQLANFVWPVSGDAVSVELLPESVANAGTDEINTSSLFQNYSENNYTIDQTIGAGFTKLNQLYRQQQPFNTYVAVPLKRIWVMWFRPRTELINIDQSEVPFEFSLDAIFYGLNLLILAFALIGFYKLYSKSPYFFWFFIVLIISRSLFLSYYIYPEPRYLLSLYPIIYILSALSFF